MTNKTKNTTNERNLFIPVASIIWLVLGLFLVLIENYQFSFNESQTRPRIAIEIIEQDEENGILELEATGQFMLGDLAAPVLPNRETVRYENREEGLEGIELARMIFMAENDILSLEINEEQREEEIAAELVVEDERSAEGDVEEDETIVTTVTHGRFVLELSEGTNIERAVEDVSRAINTYFPRAELGPDLWLPTVNTDSEKIIAVTPLNTGIQLYWFAIFYALIEGALAYFMRGSDEKLIRPLVRTIGVFLVVWSFFGHVPLWDFILDAIFPTSSQLLHPSSTVVQFASQHVELVIVSSLITIPLGLIIGIIVTREEYSEFLSLANSIVNSGQTVPTLAVVAIMAPIIGFGFWPAIIALVAYGLLPVVRNTITGLAGVDAFIIDSAKGMGMTNGQILFQIEIPIASRIIMAGIRTSLVINVGTATLGAFVGSGGLGVPISSGLSTTTYALVLLGALPAALLAILIDYVMGRIEFVLTPKGLQVER